MKAAAHSNRTIPPPGFIMVPSRSRAGEYSYWSNVLGQRYSSLDLAWTAYDKLISAKRDKDLQFHEEIQSTSRIPSPKLLSSEGAEIASVPRLGGKPPKPIQMFTDPDFPPNTKSIGKTNIEDPQSRLRISIRDRENAQWMRLPNYIRKVNNLPDSEKIQLFGDIEPNDLTQGIVGDCWLLATMACLAEFPNAIESLFVDQETDEPSPSGLYRIKLFNLDKREWEIIVIDDYIPCALKDDYSEVPYRIRAEDGVRVYDGRVPPRKVLKPLFAVPNGNQMWAALLEKAMAKFVGSYAGIAGGHEPFAMIAFTGFPQVYQFKRVPIDPQRTIARKGEWERGWAQWAGKFSPSCGYRPILDGEGGRVIKNDFFFPKLLEYDRMNYILAASVVCYPPSNTAEGLIRADGIVVGHAYSLLSVEEFNLGDKVKIRLVKLRNPHGKGTVDFPTEWKGKWSDDSDEWIKYPEIADSVGYEKVNDGIFWMEYTDFVNVFDKVLVLPFPMSEPRGALSSMRRAKLRASHRTATANGRALTNMAAMSKLKHVDEVVTAIHLMSVKPYDPYLNAPDWVLANPEKYAKWAHEKLGTTPSGQNKN